MVALVASDAADRAVALLAEHDVRAWVAGEVTRAEGDAGGTVSLVGRYPGW
jgi:phosphoribosylformylglycinamidine cyclo-ligase